MEKTIENKTQEQEMVDLNKLNDDYTECSPKKEEYPKMNFIDIEKYGVLIQNGI